MPTLNRDRTFARAAATVIRGQLEGGVLMSLGAITWDAIADGGDPGLAFQARILPFNKDGSRSDRPRLMDVTIRGNDRGSYDIEVVYFNGARRIVHWAGENTSPALLNRVLLALDYDGETTLNPRLV